MKCGVSIHRKSNQKRELKKHIVSEGEGKQQIGVEETRERNDKLTRTKGIRK